MKEIISLYVQLLSVKLFFAFMKFVVEAIDKFPVITESFPRFVEKVKAAYDYMNQIYLKYDEEFCTKKVQEADDARDRAFTKLRNAIRSVILNPVSAAAAQAAEIILEIIKLYGGAGIVNLGMNAKTTIYVNLIEDLEEKYPAQVETLGIGDMVNELKQKQEAYDEEYMRRAECNSETTKNAMTEARRLMTKAYRDLVTAVNLEAEDDEEGKFMPFIKLMNTEVGRYRTYTGQGQVGSGSGSSTDNEEPTALKNINFIFNNGTELKLWFVVGEPVVAPENTPGYEWKNLPEVMPKRSKTVREVAIEAKKFTALFHFADHKEEEIKQVAGSALTAPKNTTGYVWDPTVPATMPAEDTTYFEKAAQSGGSGNTGSGSGSGTGSGSGSGSGSSGDKDEDYGII